MFRYFSVVACAVVLAACSHDETEMLLAQELAAIDLDEPTVASRIMSVLGPADRKAFTIYMLRHRHDKAGFCGRSLVSDTGEEPSTVGEAIALTHIREAEYAVSGAPKSEAPATVEGKRQVRLTELEEQRSQLVDEQSEARMMAGTETSNELKKAMAKYDDRIARLTRNIENIREK